MSAAETPSNGDTSLDAVTRAAAGSSFYLPMRLMPKPERDAMFAIYAFCRAVDDIADDAAGPRAERRAALTQWRVDIEALYAGNPPPRAAFLKPALDRFGLVKADFLALIDGMQMDTEADIRAPTLDTLTHYCDRVACAVGRLAVKVFGMEEAPGRVLSHHLGQALQLTNILRDLDEDAAMGRLYLPREILEAAGITTTDPHAAVADSRVDAACRAVAQIARAHYAAAGRILTARPKGRLATPRIMRAVYARILAVMEADGWVSPRRRARVGKLQLFLVLVSAGRLG